MNTLESLTKIRRIPQKEDADAQARAIKSACKRLIEIVKAKKELEKAEKALKAELLAFKDDFLPYQGDDGTIRVDVIGVYEQDIKAIHKVLPTDVFMNAVNLVKSKIPGTKEEKKKYIALIDANSTKVGERECLKVIPKK